MITPGITDAQSFTDKPLTEDEVQKLISKPQPRIRIPGLNFSDIKISTNTADSGAIQLSVPYLGEYIGAVYRYLLVISSILAVVMIIIAGIQWTISGGNAEIVTKARKKIGHALLGLLLLMISYSILYLINPNLVIIDNINVAFTQPRSIDSIFYADKELPAFGPSSIKGPINKDTFDHIFKGFGNAVGLNYGLLKGIARAESNLNPLALHKRTKYAGLFQTKTGTCQDWLKKHRDYYSRCGDIFNPWVNTAVGAQMAQNALNRIKRYCGTNIDDGKTVAALMYINHNSGPGNLKKMLKNYNGCPLPTLTFEQNKDRVEEALRSSWSDYGKGASFADNRSRYAYGKASEAMIVEVGKTLSKSKDDVTLADFINTAVNGTAPNPFNTPPPSTISPELSGVNTKLLNGDISCANKYHGDKVLVLGDDFTTGNKTYFDRLRANCPQIAFDRKSGNGRSAKRMYDQIKNVDLKSYSHIIVFGGIHGILPPANTQSSLNDIYTKANADGLRVIAVTLGPAEGYARATPEWPAAITEVNNWIKGQRGGNVDVVADWNQFAARADNPNILKQSYDSGNHFMINETGHIQLAVFISREGLR